MKNRQLRPNVYSIGAIDWDARLFDRLIPLPDGTSYNSYVVRGSEKTALLDTVDPAQTGVAPQSLEAALFEDGASAQDVHGIVNHFPTAVGSVVLGRHQFDGPAGAVVHTVGPLLGDFLDVRSYGLHLHDHFRDIVLDLWVINHGSR